MPTLKLPLFFCVTILLTQILDIVSTHVCLSMGYEELNPHYGVPMTIAKLIIPLVFYIISKGAEKLLHGTYYQIWLLAFTLLFIYVTYHYTIILINNFGLVLRGDAHAYGHIP